MVSVRDGVIFVDKRGCVLFNCETILEIFASVLFNPSVTGLL
jgi:hypothetical protein